VVTFDAFSAFVAATTIATFLDNKRCVITAHTTVTIRAFHYGQIGAIFAYFAHFDLVVTVVTYTDMSSCIYLVNARIATGFPFAVIALFETKFPMFFAEFNSTFYTSNITRSL
jgi:hypothetical protein